MSPSRQRGLVRLVAATTAALLSITSISALTAAANATPTTGALTASFTASPAGSALQISFDATASSDSAGTIVSYHWDFGDGSTGAGATVTHHYSSRGAYGVTVTVIDDSGAQAQISQTLSVTQRAPVASLVATSSGGAVPLTVAVDGSASSDADGTIVSYHWDFGDGAVATSATASHVYTNPGSFTITLVVTDDKGATGTATTAIGVEAPNRSPVAVDDALDAARSGTLDVLGNDSDPDGDSLRVIASSAPTSGTVVCSALGACTYTAATGFAGDASFTYTVSDPFGHHATATVAVAVSLPSATRSGPSAHDDTFGVLAAISTTLNVLANDVGTAPLTVVATSTPSHGTVHCQPDGVCQYTSLGTYTGSDAFDYSVSDATAHEGSATVHIVIAPASTHYSVDVGGHPTDPAHSADTAIAQGDGASWSVAVGGVPPGLTQDAMIALPLPTATATISGPQTLQTGSVTTAKGWTSTMVDATTVEFSATRDALLGSSATQPFAQPLPPIGQGTGGDGHVPILVGSKVFAFFHHADPTSVTCVDRANGLRCPGYPKQLNVASSNIIGPAAIVGSRIYVHTLPTTFGQSMPIELYCWDTATDSTCGLIIVDRVSNGAADASPPVVADGRIYVAADTGRLYCVDPSTNALCAVPSQPTGFSASGSFEYDAIAHRDRVFIGRTDGSVACIDVAASSRCSGWTTARSLGGWNVINEHDAAGGVIGVCVISGSTGQCVADNAPDTTTTLQNFPANEGYYGNTQEAETGTRTLIGSLNRGGVGCWDWTTLAPCTGGGYVGGWLSTDGTGEVLPTAYGAAWDGSCVVGLGDPGLVFTVDPLGSSPCTSLAIGARTRAIDLRDQRCDRTVGTATWNAAALVDTDRAGGELSSVVVNIRDATTGAVLATQELIGTGSVDLSAIDAIEHPAITVDATATSVSGDPAWVDGIPPAIQVSWNPDPAQGCFATVATIDCAVPATAEVGVAAKLTGVDVSAGHVLGVTPSSTCPSPANRPPDIEPLGNATVPEETLFTRTIAATDPDNDHLTYSLIDPPAGATIDPSTGQLSWTPTEAQGPGTFTIGVRVADDGTPAAFSDATFTIDVTEVNRAPEIGPIDDRSVAVGSPVSLVATASDSDSPANALVFTLVDAPSGAEIDPVSGAFSWTPTTTGTTAFTIVVTDNGEPQLSATTTFSITVTALVVVAPNDGSREHGDCNSQRRGWDMIGWRMLHRQWVDDRAQGQ